MATATARNVDPNPRGHRGVDRTLFEVDEERQQAIRKEIEHKLSPIVNKAKQDRQDRLAKADNDSDRQRVEEDYESEMKTLIRLAEEQFRVALERERQEMRKMSRGNQDSFHQEGFIDEQRAIFEEIQRERTKSGGASDRKSTDSVVVSRDEVTDSRNLSVGSPHGARMGKSPNLDPHQPMPQSLVHTSERPIGSAGSAYAEEDLYESEFLDDDDLEDEQPFPFVGSPPSMPSMSRKQSVTSLSSVRGKEDYWYSAWSAGDPASTSHNLNFAHSPSPGGPSRRNSNASSFRSGIASSAPQRTSGPAPSAAWTQPIPPNAQPWGPEHTEPASISPVSPLGRPEREQQEFQWSNSQKMRSDYQQIEGQRLHGKRHPSIGSETASRRLESRVSPRPIPIPSSTTPEQPRTPDSYRQQSSYTGGGARHFESEERGVPIPRQTRTYIAPQGSPEYMRDSPVSYGSHRRISSKRSFTAEEFSQASPSSTRGVFGPSSPVFMRRQDSRGSVRSVRSQSKSRPELYSRAEFDAYSRQNVGTFEDFPPSPQDSYVDIFDEEDADFNVESLMIRSMQAKLREEEARRRDEELRKKEEETRKKEEEIKQKEEELRRREEELERREALRKKEEELRQREEALRRREEEAQREEEERQRQALRRQAEEEARRLEELKAAQEREAELARLERERLEAERLRMERLEKERAEKERLEEERSEKERLEKERLENERLEMLAEETRKRREAEEKAKAEQERLEAKAEAQRQAATRAKVEAARKREEERVKAKSQSKDGWGCQEENLFKKMDEEEKQRKAEQEEADRRFAQQVQEEEARRAETEAKVKEHLEAQRRAEMLSQHESFQRMREETNRRQQEDLLRQAETRRRQDSLGGSSDKGRSPVTPNSASSYTNGPWSIPRSSSTASNASADRTNSGSSFSNASNRSYGTSASNTSYSSSSHFPAGAKPTASAWKPAHSTPQKSSSTSFARAAPTSAAPDDDERERWKQRQEEEAKRQAERFKKEQERAEREREAREARSLSQPEFLRLLEEHDRLWNLLPQAEHLGWASFPWPSLKKVNRVEDLTPEAIGSYYLNHLWPVEKSPKERIREHIRHWHPDRFESTYLTKVRDSDHEKVKEGAGIVARTLNDLLRRTTAPL
ncbi:unnamed protein product [Somion occarium]|uniref:Uncharacterized protein n=2 Tax=Somion occarium TaxID=3059160 RepID=A0ABP1DR33_9APHY